MTMTTETRTDRIRSLNDAFRRAFVGDAVMITTGVEAIRSINAARISKKIRSFESFGEDNDPHHQHDFGAVDEAGERFFFKADYRNRKTEFGSLDPSEPAVANCMMTIMRAEEY
jgi:hypothetical protein